MVAYLTRTNLLVGNLRVGNLPRRRLGCDVFHIKMFHIVERMDLTSHDWGVVVLFLDDIRVI